MRTGRTSTRCWAELGKYQAFRLATDTDRRTARKGYASFETHAPKILPASAEDASLAGETTAQPPTIPEAKPRLAESLGVPESAIRITVEH